MKPGQVQIARNLVFGPVPVLASDLAGNRLNESHTGPGGGADESIAYTYDARNELTKEVSSVHGETDYYYDTNGSQTRTVSGSTTNTYSYDVRNKMVSVDVNGVASTYVYDDAGNRVEETTGGTATLYLPDTQT